MKYLFILEAIKNRRIFACLRDLSHKLFGFEMMLLPQLSTMLGSAPFLECRMGVCNEFYNFCPLQESISSDIFSFPPHGHTWNPASTYE